MPPPTATGRAILRSVRTPAAPRVPLAAGAYAVGVAGALALVFFGLIAFVGRDLHAPTPEAAAMLAPALMTAGLFSGPSILHVHSVAIDLGATQAISWESDKKHVPVLRFGRDVAERALPVAQTDGRHVVALPELEPGATYVYRISGWAGGGAHEGRFTAPPPGNPAPLRQRLQLLDLPDGGTLGAPTFGPPRLARPLWARESVSAELVLAGGRAVLHDGRHVHAFDATSGAVRWTHPAPRTAPPAPVVVAGAVIVATAEGLLALDLESGRPRWRLPLADVAALHVAGDEIYVHQAGLSRLHRVQATDGRLVSILPLPAVSHRVQLAGEHVLVQIDEPGDSRGELLRRALDRLRGGTRWEKLLFGDELPVLPPAAAGDRLYLARKDRIDLRALSSGQVVGSWPLPAPALLVLPAPDGGVLVCTGGPVPHAHLLDAQARLRRAWTLPSTPQSGTIAGERAALTDADGLQILELVAGPRWAITGWPAARQVSMDTEGHLLARMPPAEGSAHAERILALGLR